VQIQLVSHSSVITRASDAAIWSDPWLTSDVFNDSWRLYPPPAFEPATLESVEWVWISHEHPDHFNVPTLRSLPAAFKERVTVLFQRNNSDKVFDALRRFGFRRFRELPHRQRVALTPETTVYCYQVGQIDSCLAIEHRGRRVYNLNDATVNSYDAGLMKRDFGPASVVLNQFSTAGYSGLADRDRLLPEMARHHLDLVVQNHRDLEAERTIPFASFMIFSTEDNAYMNRYGNRPQDVADRFAREGLELAVLYPGDVLDTEAPHDSASALDRYRKAYESLTTFQYARPATVPMATIHEAFDRLAADLHEKYPQILLRRLRPVTVAIPDLGKSVRFSLADRTWQEIEGDDTDLVVWSQPLDFALRHPFGVQTLGVSARLVVRKNPSNWARHRMLMASYNAELYLKPRLLLTRRNVDYLLQRRRGLVRQIRTRIAQMGLGF
jgi:L-ascorbate metabolism protein UlaG (beta-lactamase superfamily)